MNIILSVLALILVEFMLINGVTAFRRKTSRQYRAIRSMLRMDDEMARKGIKEELTTKEDEYFESKFIKLSNSGHNLTPLTSEELQTEWSNPIDCPLILPYQSRSQFLGLGYKGLYVHKYGGSPLFSSGYRLDDLCRNQPNYLYFTEPCDPEHIKLDNNNIYCTRTDLCIGHVSYSLIIGGNDPVYVIDTNKLYFLPIDLPWPTECQPENFWGSEGQYRAWNQNELSQKPLSY